MNELAPISITILFSPISGNSCSGDENVLCRSHSKFQFEFLASTMPPLLLGAQGF